MLRLTLRKNQHHNGNNKKNASANPKLSTQSQSQAHANRMSQMTHEMIKLSDLSRQYPTHGINEYVAYLFGRQTVADNHAVMRLGQLAAQGSIAPFGDPFLRDAMDFAKLVKFMMESEEGQRVLFDYHRQKDRSACDLLRANAIITLDDPL